MRHADRMAGSGAAAMAENAKESFEEYINSAFPIDGKRTKSAVIRRSLAQRITVYLKGTPDATIARMLRGCSTNTPSSAKSMNFQWEKVPACAYHALTGQLQTCSVYRVLS